MWSSIQESCCRGTQFLAFRAAAVETWGESGWSETCALLDGETREALLGRRVSPAGWVPERHMLALADAVFAGPAGRGVRAYHAFVGNQVRLGVGRVRRMLLHLAPPERVLERAPELWRHDHTDGELVVAVEGKHAHVEIVDHLHATNDVACLTAAEIFRCVLSLTRANDVTSTYRRTRPRCLEVELRWS